jgi:DNA (cytosine-5)-methyltransferase 1
MRDSRNLLVTVIAKVAAELNPRIVVVENVQAFLTRLARHPKTNRPISAAKLLIELLDEEYLVFPVSVDLSHYGVPQTRKRTFLTFVHRKERFLSYLIENNKVPFPKPTHLPDSHREPITVREALEKMNLPRLDAKSESNACSNVFGGLHSVPVWNDRRYDMVAAIPRHTGQSAWENSKCKFCGPIEATDDQVLCSNCGEPLLRPIMQTDNGCYRLVTGFRNSTYSRMRSDRPSATITTASGHVGSNNTIHPFANRLLSTLECALIQTLPRSFKWGEALKKWGHTNVREMIGEAVPPLFTAKHGRVIRQLLDAKVTKGLLPSTDERHVRASKKLGLR